MKGEMTQQTNDECDHQFEREEVLRSRPTAWEDEERWEVAYICQKCGEEEE